jgi:iron-sulfur cluster assembly protein
MSKTVEPTAPRGIGSSQGGIETGHGGPADSGLIQISDRALEEIRSILATESFEPETGLRLGVVGGGCSGLSYHMELSSQKDNDNVISFDGGVRVLLDPKSAIYLKGVLLDFKDGLLDKGFVFKNPNATNTCGCGESFSL